jgi:hypothetical protein
MRVRPQHLAALSALALLAVLIGVGLASAAGDASGAGESAPPSLERARGAISASVTLADAAANPPAQPVIERGKEAWGDVYGVLMSPRCMNCHPAGDRPLQTDDSKPHAMNISRKSVDNGLKCSTCHQEENADELGAAGGPPGAPHWGLPDKDMPLVFEGRSESELCEQLKRPGDNGYKTLDQLQHHVAEDALVLWGWKPGGERTKPPLSHEEFVAAFDAWVNSGGACP